MGLLLASCGGDKTETAETTPADSLAKSGNTPASPFGVTVSDKPLRLMGPNEKAIIKYLFGTYADALLSASEAKKEVKTDADMYVLYHFTDSVCHATSEKHMNDETAKPQFYEVFDSVQTMFEKIQAKIPLIDLSCAAECTYIMISPGNAAWMKMAGQTSGTHDDDYFALVDMVFGDYHSRNSLGAVWFEGTWDYGGNSLLGEGLHYKVLAQCEKITKDSPFQKEIAEIAQLCFDDAVEWKTLKYTPEKAIAELEKILMLEIGKGNADAIKKRIGELRNPKKHEIQVDCEHNDCAYG